jgi:phosphoglycerate kinase
MAVSLKPLKSISLKNKRVIFRTAYDVPLEKRGNKWVVADDTRIRASIPTLSYLLKNNCKVVILTWLGRPGGKPNETLKLDPVAKRLSELIHKPVKKLNDCVGSDVQRALSAMKPKDIILLENVRFHAEEEARDIAFTEKLSNLGECVVFEAFAQSHRDYPSTTGILKALPSVAGFHMEKEFFMLQSLIKKPKAPFVVILGGAKISDKIETLRAFLSLADVILIGGAMAHNFLKVQGIKIGASYIEKDTALKQKKETQSILHTAEELIYKTKDTFVNLGHGLNVPKLALPRDFVAAKNKDGAENETNIISIEQNSIMPRDWMYLDIGPKTVAWYTSIIKKAKTIFWNGPVGYFEADQFAAGTKGIAKAIARSKALSIVGGGDTQSFIKKYKMQKKFTFVSTGGGASLELLSGKEFPVLKYLIK